MQWLKGLQSALPVNCDLDLTGEQVSIFVDSPLIRAVTKRIYKQGYFLEDVTCTDFSQGYQVLYHFDHFEEPGRITVRTIVPHDSATLPTIADIYHGAQWHERECMDFYPITFQNNPNMSNLLLPDGMEEKPLLKTEKSRADLLDIFRFTDLGEISGTSSMQDPLQKKQEEMQARQEEETAPAKETN